MLLCGICLAVAPLGPAARADDASPWAQDLRSAMRLVAGSAAADAGLLRAGIEIKLQPGWKTYWRYPGDSGVPPRFDFAGSDNVKNVTVLWPAPHGFTDESGNSIGYKDSVTFPLRIEPRQPGKPVTLHLKLDYAVCDKLCVPAQGSATLSLAAGKSSFDDALAAAEARVPKRVTPAESGITVKRVSTGPKPLIYVDLPAAAGQNVEVFAEGPTPDWALPIPKPAPGAPAGRRHFGFELDGLPPGADPKAPAELTFTVVTGDKAIEVKTRLD
jgi:DsbC/DsbD-like thiol-disulfide interchange protein